MNNIYNYDMINLIVIIFITSIILKLIYNSFNNKNKKVPCITFSCGIWAWAGDDVNKFNKSKFDILGMFNDSRGGDGSGIFKNDEIIKSSTLKTYKSFLTEKNYNNDLENPIIFGHARKSSSGGITDKNTHPFGFGKKNKYEFVGVHNGTLYNDRELSNMFESDYSEIDSHILLESIYKSKGFKPLEHYIGAAALVFVNLTEPNTLYVFKGESSKYEDGKKKEEERPLYYYQESKNSLYISSIMESLYVITEQEEDIKNIDSFESNKVYKIVNGNVEKAIKFKVNRDKCFQKEFYSTYGYGGYNYTSYGSSNKCKTNFKKNTKNKNKIGFTSTNNERIDKKDDNIFNINNESFSNEERKGGKILFENFKYQRNGHPVTGIFLNDNCKGLIKLDIDYVDALEEFKTYYYNKYFNFETNKFIRDEKEEIDSNLCYIPYNKDNINLNGDLPFVYIYEGYRLILKRDYEALLLNNELIDNIEFCSSYPTISDNEAWLKGEKVHLFRFNPLQSDYIYTIISGEVVSRKKKNKNNVCVDINSQYNYIEAESDKKSINQIFNNIPLINLNNIKSKGTENNLLFEKQKDFSEYYKNLEEDEEINVKPTVFNLPIATKKSKPIETKEIDKDDKKSLSDFQFQFNKLDRFFKKYIKNRVEALKIISFKNYDYEVNREILIELLENYLSEFNEFQSQIIENEN